MAKTILANLPADTVTYIEPFFGSGAILFATKQDQQKNNLKAFQRFAVNDLDGSITTFFRCLRDTPEALERAVELTPYSLDEFTRCLEHSDDPLEEARRVWVRSRQSFSGKASHASDWSRSSGDSAEWRPNTARNTEKKLLDFAKSLKDVAIDNIDAMVFIKKWAKGTSTFCYLDPPYLHETRSTTKDYTHEMSKEQHAELLDLVVERSNSPDKVKFLVSGYDSELYNDKLVGFTKVLLVTALHCAKERSKENGRTEVLWKNF